MPIEVRARGNLYTAEVTPPEGDWRSPEPMPSDELARKLFAIGCNPVEVAHALREAGVQSYSGYYHELAKGVEPRVRAALARQLDIPPQRPFIEAWLALALSEEESTLPLGQVIKVADSINHLIPTEAEIAWAFLRLKRRGWLVVEGDTYGLTPQGRRAIESIVGEGSIWERLERLETWTSTHPPPGDDRQGRVRDL